MVTHDEQARSSGNDEGLTGRDPDPRDPHGTPLNSRVTAEVIRNTAAQEARGGGDSSPILHGARPEAPRSDGVLIIDDQPAACARLASLLRGNGADGFHPVTASSIEEATRLIGIDAAADPGVAGRSPIRVVLLSAELAERPIMAALPLVRAATSAPVVILALAEHEVLALRACRQGASDLLLREELERTHLVRTLRYAVERHEAEVEVTARRRAYRAVLSHMRGVAYRTARMPDWRLTWVGDNFTGIVGYPKSLFIPTDPRDIPAMSLTDIILEADRERVQRVIEGAEATGEPYHAIFRIRRADGEVRWLEVHGESIRDMRGRLVGREGVLTDVTAQKEAQRALRSKENQLRQAQKLEAVGRLAGGIAHDFNNVLGAMIAHAEVALGELADAGFTGNHLAVQELTDLLTAATRAGHLTRQLLLFSRRQVPQPSVLSLNAIVSDLDRLLRRTIGVDVAIAEQLDAVHPWVYADRSQIEQIVMNLAVNARDAMPDGGTLAIRTDTVELARDERLIEPGSGVMIGGPLAPGRYVVLTVADAGHGMTIETMHRIFDPFFTTKPIGQGTGLGLATVYGVVTDAGGAIRVTSRLHHGTCFSVFLPAHDAPAAAAASTSCDRPGGTETILLVDDETAMRRSLARILSRHGYTVHDAGDVGEALRVLARHRGAIDLVLTDVMMPGLPGEVLVRAVTARTPRPRILLMSGNARGVGAEFEGQGDGTPEITTLVDGFLEKPVSIDTLLATLRAALDAPPPHALPLRS